MSTTTPRRMHRGTSLLEVTVVLTIIGILIASLYVAYSSVSEASGDETAKHALRSVSAAQQLRYESRGAFSDNAGDLASLEPSWTYVAGGTAAVSPDQVSVLVDRHDGADAVAVATINGTTCLGVVVYDPAVRSSMTGRWDAGSAPCSAAAAFTNAGVDSW